MLPQVPEHNHQLNESGYHQYADIHHQSTVVCRGFVKDHCGEQIVVMIGHGHLQIGGTHEGLLQLDHLAIARDINHIQSIERSR